MWWELQNKFEKQETVLVLVTNAKETLFWLKKKITQHKNNLLLLKTNQSIYIMCYLFSWFWFNVFSKLDGVCPGSFPLLPAVVILLALPSALYWHPNQSVKSSVHSAFMQHTCSAMQAGRVVHAQGAIKEGQIIYDTTTRMTVPNY